MNKCSNEETSEQMKERMNGCHHGKRCQPSVSESKFRRSPIFLVGGVVASWLVCSTLEQTVWVPALARDIVLCSWALYSHSEMSTGELNAGGNLVMTNIPSREGGGEG